MTAPHHQLRTRSALLGAGYSDGEILRARRSGALLNLRPGAYLVGGGGGPIDPVEQHRLTAKAQVTRLSGEPVVSHVTGAAQWRIDLWNVDLRPLYVTRAGPVTARSRPTLITHRDLLTDDEVVVVDGLRVTSAARTVVDCARTLRFEQAVVIADSALRLRLVTADELHAALDRQTRMPGMRSARRVIAFADGRSQSVGESRSRVLFALSGIPMPDLQHEVHDATGRRIAIVDFYWQDRRTVGEFDGRAKYTDYLGPGETAADAVFREKLREDAIRDLGLRVVRWVWADLSQPRDTAARIAHALGVASRR